MEKEKFLITCEEVSSLHIPRWNELPEFDLYMDQVIGLAEKYLSVLSIDGKGLLTPSMINNYVKSGVLPPPKNKKYNRTHLAMLMILCITKPVMEISAISELLQRGMASTDVAHVLDALATKFESELSTAATAAVSAAQAETGEDTIGLIAIENMLKANAARTVAMHAYRTIAPISEPAPEKTDKKAEKKSTKAKKEAKSADTDAPSEEQ
ncbi:MAG: DUF1836 domain-containing protein [Clostridia bacterium]|nr:DUF1836 domain-containing protein [Clostridia bacterium]